MKEYVPGQGSYKAEEAGSLTGISTSYNVDNNFGTLTFSRDDVIIKARGVDLALSSKFNSDHMYSTLINKVAKNDGPANVTLPITALPIPSSLMTLPFDQANFYRMSMATPGNPTAAVNGWSWNLPALILGQNIFKYCAGDGKIFDLLSVLTQEAYGNALNGLGNHSWTEGYEVTYGIEYTAENGSTKTNPTSSSTYNATTIVGYTLVGVVIPEIQQVIKFWVYRDTSSPLNFTPIADNNFKVYLSDGKVETFLFTTTGALSAGQRSIGILSTITDPAGKNTATYSYTSGYGVLQNTVQAVSGGYSNTRKGFNISSADYGKVVIGDLVIVNDEIKVIFGKTTDGTSNWQITLSGSLDVFVNAGTSVYSIIKGQLSMITHTDGRAIKFAYYQVGNNNMMAVFVSSNHAVATYQAGDIFLGLYTVNSSNQLVMYQTTNTVGHTTDTAYLTDLIANQSAFFTPIQQVTYVYNMTLTPNPKTDFITVINNVGAPTIYYFQTGGFQSHSWNNAFFHKGTCRRGGTVSTMNMERADFYIANGNYISINRVNQQAFFQASKADYQKDQHAADFQEENQWCTQTLYASLAATAIGIASNPIGFLVGGEASAALAVASAQAQYNHQQQIWANDRAVAANAPSVSAWVPVNAQTNANRLTLSSPLTVAPLQNDVYGCFNGVPDAQMNVNASSADSSTIYINYNSGSFTINDYIFIRGECRQIAGFGYDTFMAENFITVDSPLPFSADEGEQVMLVHLAHMPNGANSMYYCFYLNKPKVVRIDAMDSPVISSIYWKRIDFDYNYNIQGRIYDDTFESGGFDSGTIEGPYASAFDISNIALQGTSITTGIANNNDQQYLFQDNYTFKYDVKNFHKGQDSITRLRFDPSTSSWLFVSQTLNAMGRPCANAGYYGVMSSQYFEGGDITVVGGSASARKQMQYRFDVYGRTINTRVVSSSFEGRRIRNLWTQYVGSSNYLASTGYPDLDPMGIFGDNYFSASYQSIFNAFNALAIVGGTIEEIDAEQNVKMVFNDYDPSTMNLIFSDTVISSQLMLYSDLLSNNNRHLQGYMPDVYCIGTTTINSPTVTITTGTPVSAWVGAMVAGSGVPAGTTVLSIGSGTITLSSNATASASNVSFVLSALIGCTGTTTASSNSITNIAGATPIAAWIGASITGPGIIPGTTIIGYSGTSITISQNASASASNVPIGILLPLVSSIVTDPSLIKLTMPGSFVGSTIINTPTITITTNTTPINTGWIGWSIAGTGIPSGATIIGVNSIAANITISTNATASNAGVALTLTEHLSSVNASNILLGDDSPDSPGIVKHAITLFTYDIVGGTNNLLTITKPMGNVITLSYDSTWKSYIAFDFKILDNNIGGSTQYVCTAYNYDLKGRLTQKVVTLTTDILNNGQDVYTASYNGLTTANETVTQYTYDGMDRLLTKSIGASTSSMAQVLGIQYSDSGASVNGDNGWNWVTGGITVGLPFMVSTDYLGFRTKAYYDPQYRVVQTQRFKPKNNQAGNFTYASSLEVSVGGEQNIYNIGVEKIAQAIKFTSCPSQSALPYALNATAPSFSIVTLNTYDSIGRLVQVAWKNGDTAGFGGTGALNIIRDIHYDETVNGVITYEYIDSTGSNYVESEVINDWLGRGPLQEISYTGTGSGGMGIQRIVTNHYRHDGKLIRKDLPNKDSYFYVYDSVGKLEKMTYSDGTAVRILYDLNSNVVETIDRMNLSVAFSYNQADLQISRTVVDTNSSGWPNRGSTIVTTTYTQFGAAQEKKVENEVTIMQENFSYHLAGMILARQQIIDSLTRSVTWAYDPAGNRIEITFTGSGTGGNAYTRSLYIVNQYHPGGSDTNMYNMKAITSADGNSYLVLMQQKNYTGLLAMDNFGNSTSTTSFISYLNHGYDQFLRENLLVSSEATPLMNISLLRDFNGNILGKTDLYDPGHSYAYDGKSRLVTDAGVANTYDQLSNILSIGLKTYLYETTGPSQSQMLLSAFYDGTYTWQYGYDADGNVTQILNVNPTYNRTTVWTVIGGGIQYDYLGNLRQFNYNSGQIDCYWYNAKGLRVKKTENYQLGSASWTTTYTMFEGEIPLLVETYNGSTIYDTQCNIIGE